MQERNYPFHHNLPRSVRIKSTNEIDCKHINNRDRAFDYKNELKDNCTKTFYSKLKNLVSFSVLSSMQHFSKSIQFSLQNSGIIYAIEFK